MRVPVGLDLGLPDHSFLVFPVGQLDRYTQPLTFSSFLFALELHPGIFFLLVSEGSEWSLGGMDSDWLLDDEGSGWS